MANSIRIRCPECRQMVLMYFSHPKKSVCLKGHCKPDTDPKKSIGCDCPGSYQPVARYPNFGSMGGGSHMETQAERVWESKYGIPAPGLFQKMRQLEAAAGEEK